MSPVKHPPVVRLVGIFMSKHLRLFTSAFVLVLLFSALRANAEEASSDGLWREVKASSLAGKSQMAALPAAYRALSLNQDAMTALLARAPMEFTPAARSNHVVITIPMPDGAFARFRIQESPISLPDPSG